MTIALERPRETGSTTPPPADGGARHALTSVWVVGIVITAIAWRVHDTMSGFYAPDLHLVVDTVDGLIAGSVCALLVARARSTHRLGDRLMAEAFGLFSVASLVLSLGEELVTTETHAFTWAQSTARNGGVLLLFAAVLLHRRVARRAWRPWPALGVTIVAVVVASSTWAGGSAVQVLVVDDRQLVVDTHPGLVASIAIGAVLALASGLLLDRRQRRGHLLLGGWLAPAVVLLGFARLHYVFFPSLYSHYVFSGDVLRTAGYLMLLVGAIREIVDHWSSESRAATLEERRRLARELHDGAVQEMILARLDADSLARSGDDAAADALVESIDRALHEVRWAMDDLVLTDEDLDEVVRRVASGTAHRLGITVDVSCETAHASALVRHDVARIVREAISNASRHGGARTVRVVLQHVGQDVRLRVEDEGDGFDPEARRHGHGLVSMRERATRMGGRLDLTSAPGVGTVVEVTW